MVDAEHIGGGLWGLGTCRSYDVRRAGYFHRADVAVTGGEGIPVELAFDRETTNQNTHCLDLLSLERNALSQEAA